MSINFNNHTRNNLTEHDDDANLRNYKRINPFLWDCYNGLQPLTLSNLANVIITMILRTKLYGEKITAGEKKRIHNNIVVDLPILLRQINPKQYNDETRIAANTSNLSKSLRALDDNNVFYYMNYKNRYALFMEREIGSWKYYNALAVVTAKTLKKILLSANNVVGLFKKWEMEETVGVINLKAIEKSVNNAFGLFINRIVSKMDAGVAKKMILWHSGLNFKEYIHLNLDIIDKMDNLYEGLTEDASFITNLPPTVGDALIKMRKREEIEMKKDPLEEMKDVEKAIVPKNSSLIHRTRGKRKSSPPNVSDFQEVNRNAPLMGWKHDANPFFNNRKFIEYCDMVLRFFHKDIKLDSYSAINMDEAGKIMDLLKENNRNNKEFLDGWLKYYATNYLRGNKIYNTKYTGMKTIKSTFAEYNERAFVAP